MVFLLIGLSIDLTLLWRTWARSLWQLWLWSERLLSSMDSPGGASRKVIFLAAGGTYCSGWSVRRHQPGTGLELAGGNAGPKRTAGDGFWRGAVHPLAQGTTIQFLLERLGLTKRSPHWVAREEGGGDPLPGRTAPAGAAAPGRAASRGDVGWSEEGV